MSKTKNILITGSNGGIGSTIALAAAKAGYGVGLHYHSNNENVLRVKKEITENGGKAILLQADISKESEILDMFDQFMQNFGSIDGLINNASTIFPSCNLEDMSAERLKKIFKTNTIGSMLCAKHAIKHMSKKYGHNGGKIINISSAASRLGSANEYIDYACSKGALDTLTKGLSLELANDEILVNCIRPGFIHTDIHKLSGDPDRIDKIKDKIPLKRGGLPEEVASATMWLLSEGANYCTGTFIDIAGGK